MWNHLKEFVKYGVSLFILLAIIFIDALWPKSPTLEKTPFERCLEREDAFVEEVWYQGIPRGWYVQCPLKIPTVEK